MSTTTLQKTNISLLSLFCAANFDNSRISIAESELSDHFLTLYLEDKREPVEDLADAVMYKLPVSKFCEIIAAKGLNSYDGVLYTHSGRPYDGRIVINEPLAWYTQDATTYERNYCLDVVKSHILKSSIQ